MPLNLTGGPKASSPNACQPRIPRASQRPRDPKGDGKAGTAHVRRFTIRIRVRRVMFDGAEVQSPDALGASREARSAMHDLRQGETHVGRGNM